MVIGIVIDNAFHTVEIDNYYNAYMDIHIYYLQIVKMAYCVAVFTDSIFKYLPERVGAVDFHLHCRRGGHVNDIRKGKVSFCSICAR